MLTSLTSTAEPPAAFVLMANYPNPFNPSTTVAFGVGSARRVRLEVYDIAGRRVRTLVDGHRNPGVHRVVWDGTDAAGIPVSSGVYLYRFTAGDALAQNRKMVLVR